MFDSKFIVTLLALIISVVAICKFDKKDGQTNEGFLGMSASVGLAPVRAMKTASNKFVSVPNFQAMTSPRFDNSGLSSSIRYNMPDKKHMASPGNPFGDSSVENFTQPPSCGAGGTTPDSSFHAAPLMQADYVSGNRNEIINEIIEDSGVSVAVPDLVPTGTMESVGPDGLMQQVVMLNGLRYVNRNNRLRASGDMIRGDIVPTCATGEHAAWVPKSTIPNLSLQQGAMFALGGLDNSASKSMASLMYNATGETTVSGVQMSNSEITSLSAGMNDVSVAAFP